MSILRSLPRRQLIEKKIKLIRGREPQESETCHSMIRNTALSFLMIIKIKCGAATHRSSNVLWMAIYILEFACSLSYESHGHARPFNGPASRRDGEKPKPIDPGIQFSTSHLWQWYLDGLSYARSGGKKTLRSYGWSLTSSVNPHSCVHHHRKQSPGMCKCSLHAILQCQTLTSSFLQCQFCTR